MTKIICERVPDEERRDTVIGHCAVKDDPFIENGRILTDGEKSIMFDDCKDGACNVAIITDFVDKNVETSPYPGESESENIAFALDKLKTRHLRTAKLGDIDVEANHRRWS